MNVTIHKSAREFLDIAGHWLERQEAVNNLILGLANRLAGTEKTVPSPIMMTVCIQRELAAAALMIPPRGVVMYAPADNPREAINDLAEALIVGGYPVPECVGPNAVASLFTKIWTDRTGQTASLTMAQRIYELRQVSPPRGVPGTARLALMEDLDLLADWTYEFALSTIEKIDAQASRISAEQFISGKQMLLWEHQGKPVSMAATVRPMRHGIAISRVYTPPEHRGHGFASACVAELSQRQLDAGRQYCCLYTDLANPTSNSIYQKIGYVPVADSSHYCFHEE